MENTKTNNMANGTCSWQVVDLEGRIIELEIKAANQENMLEDLSSVLYEQQKKIDELERVLKALDKLNSPEIGPAGVKPPHY